MQNTTIQLKDKKVNKVNHYYKQYLKNYRGLNMEFAEFMASKLGVSEPDAIKAVRDWKETLITLTNNK